MVRYLSSVPAHSYLSFVPLISALYTPNLYLIFTPRNAYFHKKINGVEKRTLDPYGSFTFRDLHCSLMQWATTYLLPVDTTGMPTYFHIFVSQRIISPPIFIMCNLPKTKILKHGPFVLSCEPLKNEKWSALSVTCGKSIILCYFSSFFLSNNLEFR